MVTLEDVRRVLDEIEDNLVSCEEYNKIGTLQATIRYCDDLRKSMLGLTLCVKALRLGTQQLETQRQQLPPGGTHE